MRLEEIRRRYAACEGQVAVSRVVPRDMYVADVGALLERLAAVEAVIAHCDCYDEPEYGDVAYRLRRALAGEEP